MTEHRLEPDLTHPMHEAIFWRGVFIHRYSGFELSVAELLVRASARDEYRELGPLPYPWPKKLARLTAVIDAAGPLQPYAARIRGVIQPLLSLERHRHLLAHGLMSIHERDGNDRMLYLKTFDRPDGELGEVTMWISVDDLRQMTQEMGPWVLSFVRLLSRIFEELDFAPMATEERVELEAIARTV